MDRRRFLTLLGLGGAAGAAGSRLVGGDRPPPPSEVSAASRSQVPTPTGGVQRVWWSVQTDERAAALTFDDGPDPRLTPRILEILDRFGVKATFMMMGYNAVRYPSLVEEIVSVGHEVGGHGWKHLNLAEIGPSAIREEVEYALDRVEQVAQKKIRTFRPPYGRFNEDAVRMLVRKRADLVIWSLTRGDLDWDDPDRVADHVVQRLGPGDIILMHDGIGRGTFERNAAWAVGLQERREVEIAALPRIVPEALDAGMRFETVSDLMEMMRPVEPYA